MKKILSIIGIIFLISLMFVPLVSSTISLLYSSTSYSYSVYYLNENYPSLDAYRSGHAVAFTASASGNLTSVNFYGFRHGSIVGNLTATLQGVSGDVAGDTAIPNGTVLATCTNYVDFTEFTPVDTGRAVTFQFDGTFDIVSGSNYTVVVIASNVSPERGSSYVCLSGGSVDVAENTVSTYVNGGWFATAGSTYVSVYGSDVELSATPTPTPAPSTSSTGDEDIENLTAIILPWLVPLLICLIPALLGYKFVGELGFFIGLNVGCILAYVTLSGTAYAFPLWGIILVGVMDVAVVLMRR